MPQSIADTPGSAASPPSHHKPNGPFSLERGRFSYTSLRGGRDSARPETRGPGEIISPGKNLVCPLPFLRKGAVFRTRACGTGATAHVPKRGGPGEIISPGKNLVCPLPYFSSGFFRKQEQAAPTAARGVSRCMAGERLPQRSAAQPRTGANMPPTLTATPRVMPEAKPMLRER